MSAHPRPILKRVVSSNRQAKHTPALPFATCGRILSPHVHFPPTPSMVASTHTVHSPQTYDRKPIIVSPNYCALPDREDRSLYSPPADFEVEQRGRARASSRAEQIKGSYFHPRAYEACEPEPFLVDDSRFCPPLLVRDSSNSDEYDSDDSDDESVSTPPDTKAPPVIAIEGVNSVPISGTPMLEKGVSSQDHRPTLIRSNKRPPVRFASSVSAAVDEGCLGGF
ncbi:hypothetical protein BDW22DRAFT_1349644 [Trametopsis cervina]|nr:hypothetical protein BDW22DRAFT_1349644 [Trametopsis cervina]